jgi:hypothetical protein
VHKANLLNTQGAVRAQQAKGTIFGIPLGDLGLGTSILMAFAVGFLSFFLLTFLGIVGVAVYNGMGHQADFADSYKFIAFPAACVILVVSLIFFGTLWVRRKIRGNETAGETSSVQARH